MSGLRWIWVDVFGAAPYQGNPLPVFVSERCLSASQRQQLTAHAMAFESAFVSPGSAPGSAPGWWRLHIHDLDRELPFAGHPVLGAAVALRLARLQRGLLRFQMGERRLFVGGDAQQAELDAGPTERGAVLHQAPAALLAALGLRERGSPLPLATLSNGLRYLVLPLGAQALAAARVQQPLDALLAPLGADYLVLFDVQALELRHIANDGRLEDAATGSAACVLASYLLDQGLARAGEMLTLRQGRFLGRDARLSVRAEPGRVWLSGAVHRLGSGRLQALPAP